MALSHCPQVLVQVQISMGQSFHLALRSQMSYQIPRFSRLPWEDHLSATIGELMDLFTNSWSKKQKKQCKAKRQALEASCGFRDSTINSMMFGVRDCSLS